MTSLPNPATIWICMDCGGMFNEFSPGHPGVLVERFLVDPFTTREGWLYEGDDGRFAVHDYRNEDGRRVLVFDAPKETT